MILDLMLSQYPVRIYYDKSAEFSVTVNGHPQWEPPWCSVSSLDVLAWGVTRRNVDRNNGRCAAI